MHAPGELTTTAERKAALVARIAGQRAAIASAAHEVARPLAVLDQCLSLWRGLPPVVKFAASAVGALVFGRCARSSSLRSSLWHWVPLMLGALRR